MAERRFHSVHPHPRAIAITRESEHTFHHNQMQICLRKINQSLIHRVIRRRALAAARLETAKFDIQRPSRFVLCTELSPRSSDSERRNN